MSEISAKLRLRKRCSGRIGSGDPALDEARRRPARPPPARTRPMICAEPQSYSLPPQVVTSTSAVMPIGQQRGAEVVDAALGALLGQVQHGVTMTRARPPSGRLT